MYNHNHICYIPYLIIPTLYIFHIRSHKCYLFISNLYIFCNFWIVWIFWWYYIWIISMIFCKLLFDFCQWFSFVILDVFYLWKVGYFSIFWYFVLKNKYVIQLNKIAILYFYLDSLLIIVWFCHLHLNIWI